MSRPSPSPSIRLRAATLADLELLRHWDEQPHVIQSNPNDPWDWEGHLGEPVDGREPLIAELDGRPIGFLEILDPARDPDRYWGEVADDVRALDIWIGEERDLGRGYGTRMIQLALERCFADPEVEAVLVDPLFENVRARRFYERLGLRFVERRRFGADDCAVHRIDRADWRAGRSVNPAR